MSLSLMGMAVDGDGSQATISFLVAGRSPRTKTKIAKRKEKRVSKMRGRNAESQKWDFQPHSPPSRRCISTAYHG